MEKQSCSKDREWCKGLTAIASLLSLVVAIQAIAAIGQERRIAKMEAKNDTIVELKTDMRYLKDSVAEIATEIKLMNRDSK